DEGLALAGAVETAETRVAAIYQAASSDLAALPARFAALWPEGWAGPAGATALAVAACAAAWLAAAPAGRWIARRTSGAPRAADGAKRYWALLRHVGTGLAGAALQVVLAVIVFVALTERGSPDRDVGYAVILVGFLCLRL